MINKIIALWSLTLLTTITAYSQTEIPQSVDQTIALLEEGFLMKNIDHVSPVLASEFKLNDFSPLVSKQALAGILGNLPLKKIKKIDEVHTKNDTIIVDCKLILDKLVGLSQSIKLELVPENNKLLIQRINIPSISMKVVAEGNDSDSSLNNIHLDDYEHVIHNGTTTFYEQGLDSIAILVNQKQVKGIRVAEKILDDEIIFKIGLLLLKNNFQNATIDQPVMPVTIDSDDYETSENTSFTLNWAYFHELVELHLVMKRNIRNQNTRWFRDGLADYVAHRVAHTLNPKADSMTMKKRIKSYDNIGRKANLLEWVGTGDVSEESDGIVGGPGQYAGALLFFIDLTEKYGENIIPELLKQLELHQDVSSQIIINELNNLTGSNIKKMIEKY